MRIDLKNPYTQRSIVAALVGFAALYGYFRTSYLSVCYPRRSAVLAELREKEEQLERDVREARLAIRHRARLEVELATLNKRWTNASAAIPERSSPDEVLREVSVAAQESNVTVGLVRPLPAQPGPKKLYMILPATVDVTGQYGDVTLFLRKLATCPRLIDVSRMKMTGIEKREGDATLKASLKVLAYARSDGSGQ